MCIFLKKISAMNLEWHEFRHIFSIHATIVAQDVVEDATTSTRPGATQLHILNKDLKMFPCELQIAHQLSTDCKMRWTNTRVILSHEFFVKTLFD